MTAHVIGTVEQLESLYGMPPQTSIRKEVDHLTVEYQDLIERSPFVALATSGSGGIDCSPKGDPAGFVRVVDSKTLRIPDRKGNNRLDGLRNIIEDPRVGLLFLIPGLGETLRVNGTAKLVTDPEILGTFEMRGRTPTVVIDVTVESAYYHCSKAIIRSKLWEPDGWPDVTDAPTCGRMIGAITGGEMDGDEIDRTYPQRQLDNLY
jgi:PPOX class probable FMN-dependent enzyme